MKSKNFKNKVNDSIFIDMSNKKSQQKLLKLKNNSNEFIYMKYLEWDTQFFGKKSYILDIEKSNFTPNKKMINSLKSNFKNSFITVKINSNYDYKYIDFLQKCGFNYIDTEVELNIINNSIKNYLRKSEISIERLKDNIDLPYKKLGSSFSLTRFHTDLNIDNVKADLLWIKYLKNFIPNKNKYLYIAKVKNKIAAVALVNINNNNANLFYIVVIDKFRSLGIGNKLISTIKSDFNNYTISTGTQIKNIKALNFYLKNNFVIKNTYNIFHKWK
jgi:ribosomal protein S18 acetylase RimI-like enzyme